MTSISTEQCNYSSCNKGSTPWFDFSLNAKWTKNCYKPYELKCRLVRQEIGLSSANVFPDGMHDKYIGTDTIQGILS